MKTVHEDGVENIACALVDQARKDFIKGGKTLYAKLKAIPSYSELVADYPSHISLSNNADVRWMYDAWRFVRDDPYQFFGDVGEDVIIATWKEMAIEEYYKIPYIKAGIEIYRSRPKTKKIQSLDDSEIISILKDNKLSAEFISARNYISKLQNANELFKEWNIIAMTRSKKLGVKGKGFKEYVDDKKSERQKKVEKAIELYTGGMNAWDIAKELGVTRQTVWAYLRS